MLALKLMLSCNIATRFGISRGHLITAEKLFEKNVRQVFEDAAAVEDGAVEVADALAMPVAVPSSVTCTPYVNVAESHYDNALHLLQ